VYIVVDKGDGPQGSAGYQALNNGGLDAANAAYDDLTVLHNIEVLRGTQYNDSFMLRDDADIVHAGAGNDWIQLGGGNDEGHGDAGNDNLLGGAGDDRLWGGLGADTFRFDAAKDGNDAVMDYNKAEGDVVRLTGLTVADADAAFAGSVLTDDGLLVDFGASSITFAGVTDAADISWLVA
jgi:Ca2+-binding RTX toxin-like protein